MEHKALDRSTTTPRSGAYLHERTTIRGQDGNEFQCTLTAVIAVCHFLFSWLLFGTATVYLDADLEPVATEVN